MKKYLVLILSLLLCTVCIFAHGAEDDRIEVLYNGKSIEFDTEPYYLNGRIMVPVRAIFEALGANVKWDDATGTASALLNDTTVSMTLGQNVVIINGVSHEMDAPVEMHSDRIHAPARFVAESFGKKISYHEHSQTAVISDSNEYSFYTGITKPVPRFEWVSNASLVSNDTLSDGKRVYTYICDENGLTDYLNFLQLDFGYYIYNMEYLEDSVRYIYALDGLEISVTEQVDADGVYTVEVIPDIRLLYKAEEEIPTLPQTQDSDGITYDDVDYGAVTNSALLDVYDDDGKFYIYEYSPVDVALYESYIQSDGWRFCDYNINIDTFGYIKYWEKDGYVLCVSINHLYGLVMVSIM